MKQLKKTLANVLGIPESDITDETSPDNAETWDSFNHLMLISEVETNFSVKFTMAEVRSIKSVKDIKEILNRYKLELK